MFFKSGEMSLLHLTYLGGRGKPSRPHRINNGMCLILLDYWPMELPLICA